MSGHSKWSTIKRQKAVTDAKRSTVFTKHARLITVAARQGGGDPGMNFQLRLAIDKARASNMPNDNIDRAIKAGTGDVHGEQAKELSYEGFGPGGVAIVVDTVTDNSNRTASDIRSLFSKHGGSLGGQNSVRWMFELRGILRFPSPAEPVKQDELMLEAVEAGAEDARLENGTIVIVTSPEAYSTVHDWAQKKSIHFDEAGIELIPKTTVTPTETETAQLHSLLDSLEEHPDVTNLTTNEV